MAPPRCGRWALSPVCRVSSPALTSLDFATRPCHFPAKLRVVGAGSTGHPLVVGSSPLVCTMVSGDLGPCGLSCSNHTSHNIHTHTHGLSVHKEGPLRDALRGVRCVHHHSSRSTTNNEGLGDHNAQ